MPSGKSLNVFYHLQILKPIPLGRQLPYLFMQWVCGLRTDFTIHIRHRSTVYRKYDRKVKMLVAHLCPSLYDLMDCSPTGSFVHGILRQEYWSALLFPSPGDLPNPGIKPGFPALQADSLPSEPPGKSIKGISVQFSSVTQSCPTLCDPIDWSTPGFPVHHQLPEFTQTHVHGVGDAIQPSHSLSSPSPPAFSLSQHQGAFQWVSSSH